MKLETGRATTATHITMAICPCGCKSLLLVYFDAEMKPLSAFKTGNEEMLTLLEELKGQATLLTHTGPPQ